MSTTTLVTILIVAALIVAAFFLGMVAVRLSNADEPIGDLKMLEDDYDGHVYFYMELDPNVVGVRPEDYISARKSVRLNVTFSQKNRSL